MSKTINHFTILTIAVALCAACSGNPESTSTTSQQQTGPGWFVASEIDPVRGDSFLIYLDDPADIQVAEQLITHQRAPATVAAKIASGSDGINRDVIRKTGFYHWHVTEFTGFDVPQPTVIDPFLDGSPTLIEADVDGWIDYSDGLVVFPNYTITARHVSTGNG